MAPLALEPASSAVTDNLPTTSPASFVIFEAAVMAPSIVAARSGGDHSDAGFFDDGGADVPAGVGLSVPPGAVSLVGT